MVQNIESEAAWRSYYKVISGATVVALALLLPRLFRKEKAPDTQQPSATLSSYQGLMHMLKVFLADILDAVLSAGAMVCIQFALYLGTSGTWNTATVISLLTAGFGGSLTLLALHQFIMKKRASFMPAMIPFRALSTWRWIETVLVGFWGFSFYSFSYFLRKPPFRLSVTSADHLQPSGFERVETQLPCSWASHISPLLHHVCSRVTSWARLCFDVLWISCRSGNKPRRQPCQRLRDSSKLLPGM